MICRFALHADWATLLLLLSAYYAGVFLCMIGVFGCAQVDVCLFDKTGTITSDRLLAETLVAPQSLRPDGPPEMVKLPVSNRGGVNETGDASEMPPEGVANSRAILASEVQRHNHTKRC